MEIGAGLTMVLRSILILVPLKPRHSEQVITLLVKALKNFVNCFYKIIFFKEKGFLYNFILILYNFIYYFDISMI